MLPQVPPSRLQFVFRNANGNTKTGRSETKMTGHFTNADRRAICLVVVINLKALS
jgi:hypothetical protein